MFERPDLPVHRAFFFCCLKLRIAFRAWTGSALAVPVLEFAAIFAVVALALALNLAALGTASRTGVAVAATRITARPIVAGEPPA